MSMHVKIYQLLLNENNTCVLCTSIFTFKSFNMYYINDKLKKGNHDLYTCIWVAGIYIYDIFTLYTF